MRKTHWLALGGLVVGLAIGLGTARSQFAPPPPAPPPGPLQKEVARASQVDEERVVKILDTLGPEVARQLAAGREVSFPGFGTFRVVRLAETRNLEDGRPVTQPARNIVEFLPDPNMDRAANARNAVPAVEVPAFQYIPLPNQTPSQKVPYSRTPSTRIR